MVINYMLYQIRDAFSLPEISRFIHKNTTKHILTRGKIRSIHPAALGFCFALQHSKSRF